MLNGLPYAIGGGAEAASAAAAITLNSNAAAAGARNLGTAHLVVVRELVLSMF